MTELTREQVAALLDAVTEATKGRKLCFVHCDLPDCDCDVAARAEIVATGALRRAAPDLARLCLSLMDRLADADMAQAALIERAVAMIEPKSPRPCDCESCYCGNPGDARDVASWDTDAYNAKTIRALAPDAGVQALAELRAEVHSRETEWAAIVDELRADRDRLAAKLAEAEAQVAALLEVAQMANAALEGTETNMAGQRVFRHGGNHYSVDWLQGKITVFVENAAALAPAEQSLLDASMAMREAAGQIAKEQTDG